MKSDRPVPKLLLIVLLTSLGCYVQPGGGAQPRKASGQPLSANSPGSSMAPAASVAPAESDMNAAAKPGGDTRRWQPLPGRRMQPASPALRRRCEAKRREYLEYQRPLEQSRPPPPLESFTILDTDGRPVQCPSGSSAGSLGKLR